MEKQDSKILDKVRKLIAKAKNPACTEAEIELFMKKAQELMIKHNLEKSDVEINISDINKDVVFCQLWKAFKYKYADFEWELIDMIANNCRIFKGLHYDFDKKDWESTKRIKLSVIGTYEDRTMVIEMYEMLAHKFLSLGPIRYKEYQERTKKEIASRLESFGLDASDIKVQTLESRGFLTRKNTYICSYLSGCITGLKAALELQKKETLKIEGSETYGLVVVRKDELIKLSIPSLIGEYKTNKVGSKAGYCGEAFDEGVKDGKSNHTNKILDK